MTFLSTLRGDGETSGDIYCLECATQIVLKGENPFIFIKLTNHGDSHTCCLCDREEHPQTDEGDGGGENASKPPTSQPGALAGHPGGVS